MVSILVSSISTFNIGHIGLDIYYGVNIIMNSSKPRFDIADMYRSRTIFETMLWSLHGQRRIPNGCKQSRL